MTGWNEEWEKIGSGTVRRRGFIKEKPGEDIYIFIVVWRNNSYTHNRNVYIAVCQWSV